MFRISAQYDFNKVSHALQQVTMTVEDFPFFVAFVALNCRKPPIMTLLPTKSRRGSITSHSSRSTCDSLPASWRKISNRRLECSRPLGKLFQVVLIAGITSTVPVDAQFRTFEGPAPRVRADGTHNLLLLCSYCRSTSRVFQQERVL